MLIPSLYATSARSLRPVRVSSDQNTRWRLPHHFFTAKRQRIPCLPTLTRFIPPHLYLFFVDGRSPRRRSRAIPTNYVRCLLHDIEDTLLKRSFIWHYRIIRLSCLINRPRTERYRWCGGRQHPWCSEACVISFGQTRTVFLATGEKDFVEGMRYYELINVHSLLEFYYNCNKEERCHKG